MKILWVLGAPDPEMQMIEEFLSSKNNEFVYALGEDGKRVFPGNMYKANINDINYDEYDAIFLVECYIRDIPADKAIVIDHHKPGDFGYGSPPVYFWEASSLGQVIRCYSIYYMEDVYISKEMKIAAAADHCLLAAYSGRCPGIDPDEVMSYRIETRAKFQNRPIEDILEDVKKAISILKSNKTRVHVCTKCGAVKNNDNISIDCAHKFEPTEFFIADLRELTPIPELPEAAARAGIAFISKIKDRDGREKVVIQSAPPELIEYFMSGKFIPDIKDIYGDPSRGFAGGYIKKENY